MARTRNVRRRAEPVTDEALRREQADLATLTKHPAWPSLEAAVERRARYMEKTAVALILHGKGMDPVQQATMRGFNEGMRWFLAQAPAAEKKLVRWLEEQGIDMEGVET